MSTLATAMNTAKNKKGISLLVVLLPFIMAASLYLSVVFAVFSAIPLVYAYIRLGRWGGLLASISNLAIVWFLLGQFNASIFFVTAVILAAVIAEAVKLKFSPNSTVLASGVTMLLALSLMVGSYSFKYNVNPIVKLQTVVSEAVDKVIVDIEKYKASTNSSVQEFERLLLDPEQAKKNILNELLSVIGIFFIAVAMANFVLLMKVNPFQIRGMLGLDRTFFKKWKVPDILVWPTLVAGFCLVVEIPYISSFAMNVFKILMSVYAIQGLAILSTVFDAWKIKKGLRPLTYLFALAVLLPLVISLGFFDLWFDFRAKLKSK